MEGKFFLREIRVNTIKEQEIKEKTKERLR